MSIFCLNGRNQTTHPGEISSPPGDRSDHWDAQRGLRYLSGKLCIKVHETVGRIRLFLISDSSLSCDMWKWRSGRVNDLNAQLLDRNLWTTVCKVVYWNESSLTKLSHFYCLERFRNPLDRLRQRLSSLISVDRIYCWANIGTTIWKCSLRSVVWSLRGNRRRPWATPMHKSGSQIIWYS